MITISCGWAKMGPGEIPAFDKTEGTPLLVLSDDGIIDQTKSSKGVLMYFVVSARNSIAVQSRILGCMKFLYDEGERLGMNGHFIGVLHDSMENKNECYNSIGLGYIAEEIAFSRMTEEECAKLFLPTKIVI